MADRPVGRSIDNIIVNPDRMRRAGGPGAEIRNPLSVERHEDSARTGHQVTPLTADTVSVRKRQTAEEKNGAQRNKAIIGAVLFAGIGAMSAVSNRGIPFSVAQRVATSLVAGLFGAVVGAGSHYINWTFWLKKD